MIVIGPQGLDYYEPSRSHYVLTIMSESTLMTKGYFVDAYYVSNGVLIETSQCGTDDFNRIISSQGDTANTLPPVTPDAQSKVAGSCAVLHD